MPNRQYDAFIGGVCEYDEAEIVLFGAPFDSTTSFRPGARFGPKAIRADSYGIETYSPYQDKDLSDLRVFDCSDLELPFGNAEKALDIIQSHTAQILGDNKIPVMLGGEHLVTLGAVRAAAARYPGLCVIHFDAHADLRREYLGETLSHATVMRRVWDILGDGKIHQFGIRSGESDEFSFAREHTNMNKFDFSGLERLPALLKDNPVYLTVDLDVLDPSVFSGTGTPEPGGVSFSRLHSAMLSLKGLNFVGCDLVELAPAYDQSGASTAAACKLLRELLLTIGNGTGGK